MLNVDVCGSDSFQNSVRRTIGRKTAEHELMLRPGGQFRSRIWSSEGYAVGVRDLVECGLKAQSLVRAAVMRRTSHIACAKLHRVTNLGRNKHWHWDRVPLAENFDATTHIPAYA